MVSAVDMSKSLSNRDALTVSHSCAAQAQAFGDGFDGMGQIGHAVDHSVCSGSFELGAGNA